MRLRPRSIYDVFATLALFGVIAGGTAYAANTVFSTDIVDGQVKSVDLGGAAVVTAKIADGAITSAKVQDGSLQGRDVLDNSLKGSDIDESSLSGVGGGVGAAEAWQAVAAGSTTSDACANPANVAVFCEWPSAFHKPWTNFGDPHPAAGFYKDQLGIVHLKGVVKAPGATFSGSELELPIFRLPQTYRPATRRTFASVGTFSPTDGSANFEFVAPARVDVFPDGLVMMVQDCDNEVQRCSANTNITLDGVDFRPGS